MSLKKVLQNKFELQYADNYKGILDKVIVQLLHDKKTNHLQAYGSSLETQPGRSYEVGSPAHENIK